MSHVNTTKTKEEMIEQIRRAGASIVNNAENIIGDITGLLVCNVSFDIKPDMNELATIEVKRSYIADEMLDGVSIQGGKNK